MSGMNPWLASIYGTDGADDLEKTAQTHLLNKLAADNNIDLSQLSDEDAQALLQEIMGEQVMAQGQQAQPGALPAPQAMAPQAPVQQPQGVHPSVTQAFAAPQAQPQVPQGFAPQAAQQQGGADMASLQKEAQAKFEEADLLGRVMAHAYTQELEKIAASKTAGKMDAVKGAAGKAGNFLKNNKKAVGAAAATGAAGFAAGRMSKKASANVGGPAFQKLAEMHAADILGAAGFDPSTGQDQWAAQAGVDQNPTQVNTQGQEQVQGQGQEADQQGNQEQQFASALDEASLSMLAEAGYDVNEILARIAYAQQQGQGQA